MHAEEIKAAMRMRNKTPSMLASELSISPSSVSQTIHGAIKSPRIQQAIAEVLGLSVSEIWPGQMRLRREKNASPVHERAGLKPAPVMNSTH